MAELISFENGLLSGRGHLLFRATLVSALGDQVRMI